MFKCKECGTEYEVKPDYCDCGNDAFDEILPREPQEIKDKQAEDISDKNDMWVEENGFGYPVNEEAYNNMKKETKEAMTQNNTPALQPYAIITFAICILLSLLIILFAFNPKNAEEEKTETKAETTNLQNIPSIEKLWNNSTEGISAYQNNGKKETTTTSPQQIKTEPKAEDNSKKKVEVIKPQKQNTPKNVVSKSVKNQTVQQTKASQKPVSHQSTVQNNSPKTVVTKQDTKANHQEIANYHIKLRNYIASKISFASVVGDGDCTFSFKVASDGTLTNKKATKLSENDSLNDAVYNALRQVYSYNAPPAGYKSQMLNLTVKMYNNSFEVYLN